MSSKLSALWQDLALRPFAPLVLAAWEDGHLTPAELLDVRSAAERAGWLSEADVAVLRAWLDPEAPPSPKTLATLQREVGNALRSVPATQRGSLSTLGSALYQGASDGDTSRSLRSLLEPMDELLAYDEQGALGATARTHGPEHPDSAQTMARLTGLLDGPYAGMRTEVRKLLDDPSFRFVSTLSTRAYREQVMTWLRAVAKTDILQQVYPHGLEAGRDIGQFVAAFEMLAFFDLSLVVKFGVQFGLFGGSIEGLGTEKHYPLLSKVASCELVGCFAMTERARGSNVRDLGTIARYDADTREFVITTPNLAAGKEWIGNAALHASTALVFAQLETQGERYGVHAFLVPIRDEHGALVRAVRVEDCGEKMGLNGVDNGRLWFDDVRVPRDALLDRFGQVSEDGEYHSQIPSSGKRFFTMLGTLVGGRVAVASGALSASKVGLAIALRYATQRTQFPDEDGKEKLLIDYVTHRRRLLPRLAAAYAFNFAQHELVKRFTALGRDDDTREIETLAAGLKALGTWQAVDTLQQCRECCGGQGYLSSNRIDALRTDTDVFTTFEGDNTVLLQLVAKELLFTFKRALKKNPVRTVASALLENVVSAVTERNPVDARRDDTESLRASDFLAGALRFREKSLLESLTKRILSRSARGVHPQAAFEQCQDHALSLSKAHIELFVLRAMQEGAKEEPLLEKLAALYGLWRVESDAGWFLENGYFAGTKARAIRSEINVIMEELVEHVPLLVDAFSIPPSCLGPLADADYLRATGLSSAHSAETDRNAPTA